VVLAAIPHFRPRVQVHVVQISTFFPAPAPAAAGAKQKNNTNSTKGKKLNDVEVGILEAAEILPAQT
jgi:hypothetical protein